MEGGGFRTDPERGGLESLDFLKGLVEGKAFRIVSHGYDRFGRLLGVLWLEGREESVNMLMLLNGWARASESEARLTVGDFTARDAESCALSKGIGIWAWSA